MSPLFPPFIPPQRDLLETGTKRNFQVLVPLDFIAEFTQHIPPKGSHLVRYYGWYSNKARGLRAKAAANGPPRPPGEGRGEGSPGEGHDADLPSPTGRGAGGEDSAPALASQTWAMLIKRVYEVDPLACPRCGGTMKVVAFIEPPQGDVIERILRHCGLWNPSAPRPPPARNARVYDPDLDSESPSDEPRELTYVDEDTFWATF